MITRYHAIRDAAQHIAGAIDRSVTALHERRIEHEPAMTDRMLGAIEESLVSYQAKGIRWSAETLRLLSFHGFAEVGGRGSHRVFVSPAYDAPIVLAPHGSQIKSGYIRAIREILAP